MATVKDVRDLERVPAYKDGMDELATDVLVKAQKNFGYDAHDLTHRGPLGKALKELDIKPFDRDAVNRYKKSKEREYKTGVIAARGFAHFFIPAVTGLVLLMLEVQKLHISSTNWLFITTLCVFLTATILSMAAFGAMVDSQQVTKTLHKWAWKDWNLCSTPYDQYKRFIPVHVLNLANQIHEKMPGAMIAIDELIHTVANIPNPVPDPFLWVKLGGELYYIEAWDERDFRDNA